MHSRATRAASRRAADRDLATVLEAAIAAGAGPGGAVALVEQRRTQPAIAAGLADLATGRILTTDAPMAIGSLSKTFTAAAVLRLRDAGRLSLTDPVLRHLPEVGRFGDPFRAAASVTLRDLLTHMAGLPCEAPSPDPRRWDPAPIAVVLADPGVVTWAIPPGSTHKYSNLGYDLLGEVIARTSGQPYAAFVTSMILAPLGMARTTFGSSDPSRAVGHDPADAAGRRRPSGRPPAPGASGGWWSTADDLVQWVRFQLEASAEPSVRDAHRPSVVTDPRLGAAYGLGWRVERRGDDVHVGHGGLTTGFEARIEVDHERGVGVVVLLDGIGPGVPTADLAAALFGLAEDTRSTAPAPRSAHDAGPTTGPDPSKLAGRYREVGFTTIATVGATSDGLWFRVDDDPGGPLHPTADPDRFRLDRGRMAGELLVALRDAHGQIDAINVAGYPMTRLQD